MYHQQQKLKKREGKEVVSIDDWNMNSNVFFVQGHDFEPGPGWKSKQQAELPLYHFLYLPTFQENNTITDGGSTAMHSKVGGWNIV